MYAYIHLWMYVWIYVFMHVCMYVCMCMYTHTYIQNNKICTWETCVSKVQHNVYSWSQPTLIIGVNYKLIMTGPILATVSQYSVFASFKEDFVKFDRYNQPLHVRDSESWIASICLYNPHPSLLSFLCRCWRVEKEEVWARMRVEERLLWERVQLIESGRLETQMCPGDIGLRGNWKAGHPPSQQNQCGNEYRVSSPVQETPIESAESLLYSSVVVRQNWAVLWNMYEEAKLQSFLTI